jgi:hypothetical protein
MSLFESLMCFIREAVVAGMELNQLKGLSDTFIHSYCSILDLVQVELLENNDSDHVFLTESSSLLVIFKYLRMIFDKLSRKK